MDGFLTIKILIPVLTFILGAFFSTVKPPIVDELQYRLATYLATRSKSKFGTKSGLGGSWDHMWTAEGSGNWPDKNYCKVTLRAVGRRFAGIYIYKDRRWFVSGKLGSDRIIEGTWRELTAYDGYRGIWFGKLDLNDNIVGWYLGNSDREPSVGAGEWIWWREGKNEPPLPRIIVQIAQREER